MKASVLASLATALIIAAGCDSNSEPTATGARKAAVTLNGFPSLPEAFHYQTWININGEDQSLGAFSVDNQGRPATLDGTHIPGGLFETGFDLDSSLYAFVTIEQAGNTSQGPSKSRLMGGLFSGMEAELSVIKFEGLEDNLVLATGRYILATPTNGPGTDEKSGIWFVDLSSDGRGRGLQIPIPLEGWRYEGWVITEGHRFSTGAITHHSRDDLAAPYSGSSPTFGYPGEDFLYNAPPGVTFPLDLSNAQILVTIEPYPDPDPDNPWVLELFSGRVPGEPIPDSTYYLRQTLETFPTATIQILDS